MASTLTRKRVRSSKRARRTNHKITNERYLVDADGKRIAVVLDLEEYRQLVGQVKIEKPAPMSAAERARLVALARQAEGSWKESEGSGTAVEIVRRWRDEWKHRPS